MSLTKCKICGQPLSEEALFCPHCGHPYLIKEYLIKKQPIAPAAVVVEEEDEVVVAIPEEQPKPTAPAPQPAPEAVEAPTEEEVEAEEPYDEEDAAEARYRRNERMKLWIFVIISALILGTILFFYFTTTPGEDAEADATEMVEEEAAAELASPEELTPTDTPEAPAAAPAAAPAPVRPAAPAAAAPAPKPAATHTAEEPREVTVSSLREQIAPAHHDTPSQPAAEE